jgi:hypothetical protein
MKVTEDSRSGRRGGDGHDGVRRLLQLHRFLTELGGFPSVPFPRGVSGAVVWKGSRPPRKPLENSLALVFARRGWKGSVQVRCGLGFLGLLPKLSLARAGTSSVLLTPRSRSARSSPVPSDGGGAGSETAGAAFSDWFSPLSKSIFTSPSLSRGSENRHYDPDRSCLGPGSAPFAEPRIRYQPGCSGSESDQGDPRPDRSSVNGRRARTSARRPAVGCPGRRALCSPARFAVPTGTPQKPIPSVVSRN